MTLIAGMASNRGRNLIHIQDLKPGGAELSVVLTNESDAPVLESAEERGIETVIVEQSADESRREHERRVVEALAEFEFDVVALDGYMRVLSDTFLDAVPPTLNVHPSLLPSFPGMDAHEQVLEAGVAITGCTVHVVTNAVAEDGSIMSEEVDAGPIVAQEAVPVFEGDTPQSLKERVLYEAEFKAYPRAIEWFAEDRLTIEDDAAIVDGDRAGQFPLRRGVSEDKVRELRYGENPHQDAAVYRDVTVEEASVVAAEQLNPGAKALSYNNYNDADAALNLIKEFDEPAAAVIKHANPTGVAVADTVAEAYDRALSTDPKSAFGGIVALNRDCDSATAEQIVDSFKEVVVAPGYTEGALDVLTGEDNLRVLDVSEPLEPSVTMTEKPLVGGRLVQDRDLAAPDPDELEIVTEREPTQEELASMVFAWQTVKHVKSNAILFASGTETVGVGMGQVSRVDAVKLAAMKAESDAEGKSAEGAVMASDAFFPFRDGIDEAAAAGISAVVQPGGSVNDEAVIEAANEHDMAMAFTGTRA
ncbi:MAG: bifunctional phosphoribosylaminoimidazolecarboxamide formyltransferase/IMP cyclohydrolase, partial [Halanaeroarchaeum sp.]